MAATINEEHTEIIDGEEFVEVGGKGGDHPDTLSFRGDEPIAILGTYSARKENVGQNKSTVHSFTGASVNDTPVDYENGEVQAWGSAILDDRLADVPFGTKVKVVYTGQRIPTKNGSAKDFKVLVARSALV